MSSESNSPRPPRVAPPTLIDASSFRARDLWLGKVIDDRYRVLECVGRGGMGTVYKVQHVRMGKIAALKMLHHSLSTNAELVARFRDEAEAISRLNHPNIVQVFDFSSVGETLYLVMEYLDGENLGDVLGRDGPWSIDRCVRVLVQVCDALTEAHASGIIHRDLKPENIQVARTRSGQDVVKVLDFGLAKVVDKDPSRLIRTKTGRLAGTPYYMAPEQIRAQPLDHRCDIYSLGAVTFRMLTGKHPFTAATPIGVLTKHVSEPLVPPSVTAPELGIRPEVDALVETAMAKNRDHRFATATAFKNALMEAVNRTAAQSSVSVSSPALAAVSTPSTGISDGPMSRRASDQPPVARERGSRLRRTTGMRRVQEYEAALRRMGWIKGVSVLATAVVIAVVALWLVNARRQAAQQGQEVEPNNTLAAATPLVVGKTVTGMMGKRLSDSESDRDWYRLDVAAGAGPQQLRLWLSGLPNMDLMLQLFDARGEALTSVDSGGQGVSELLLAWPIEPGTYHVLVREVWRVGSTPTENVTDRYQLQATIEPRRSGWEQEPNDSHQQANALRLPSSIRGYLGSAVDQDTFSFPAFTGVLRGEVSAIDGVDLVVVVWHAGHERQRRTFDRGRISEPERIRFPSKQSDGPVLVRVERKHRRKPENATVPGLEQDYHLQLSVIPR